MKKYSKLNEIPYKQCNPVPTEGCLVLEGGAFRGVYTSGVVDELLLNGYLFQTTVGVSAGALNGYNYAAGQCGRAARLFLGYRHDPKLVGLRPLFTDKGVISFSHLFNGYEKVYPFNKEEFYKNDHRFLAVVTSLTTGKAEFMEKGIDKDMKQAIRASASMPYISKPVMIDDKPYLDGGIAMKMAYPWALENGFRKIIMVRTNAKSYVRNVNLEKDMKQAQRVYGKKYPEFAKTLGTSNARYNTQSEELKKLEEEGRVFVIYPSTPVTVSRLESDMEKLGALYEQGRNDMKKALPLLKAYLEK